MIDINGYEGLYSINEFGEIISTPRCGTTGGRIKARINNDGYKYVSLSKDNVAKPFKVHRLVGLHFIENGENLPCLNHIDGNKLNNHMSNLEWCTHRHNINHAWGLGLSRPLVGDRNGNSSVTDKQRLEIVKMYALGEKSQYEICKSFGITQSNISLIIKSFLRKLFESGQAISKPPHQ